MAVSAPAAAKKFDVVSDWSLEASETGEERANNTVDIRFEIAGELEHYRRALALMWTYVPARRNFSFAELNGNVERFEARCENNRISADVETGSRWSLPADWGSCRIFVFGDDAATFDFIEHGGDTGDSDVGRTAVVSSDVVDR